ncbi:MAG: hypothetical protein M1831_007097 [Alyxoria varia]|nr:MAG: hypothetical protein M1831_007097 [Alyxoria varia]
MQQPKRTSRNSVALQFVEQGLLESISQKIEIEDNKYFHEGFDFDITLTCHGLILLPILPKFLESKDVQNAQRSKRKIFNNHNEWFHRAIHRSEDDWSENAVSEALEAFSYRCDAHLEEIEAGLHHCRLWLTDPSKPKDRNWDMDRIDYGVELGPDEDWHPMLARSCLRRLILAKDQIFAIRRRIDKKKTMLTTGLLECPSPESRKALLAFSLIKPVFKDTKHRVLPLVDTYSDNNCKYLGSFPTFEVNIIDETSICWILGKDETEFYDDPKNWMPNMCEEERTMALVPVDEMEFKSVTLKRNKVESGQDISKPQDSQYQWPSSFRPSKQSLYLHLVVRFLISWRLHHLAVERNPALLESSNPWTIWPTTQPYLRKSFIDEMAALVGVDGRKITGTFEDGSESDDSLIRLNSRDLAWTVVQRMTQTRLQMREYDYNGDQHCKRLRDEEEVSQSDDDYEELDGDGNERSTECFCRCLYHRAPNATR